MTFDAEAGHPGYANPLPSVEKPATVRRLGPADVGALAVQVDRLSAKAWLREDSVKPNRFACFQHTRHIVFRFIVANRDPRHFYSTLAWRVWRAWLLPLMERAAGTYALVEPVFPKVMLARLATGQGIDTHTDGNDGEGSHPLVHKVHIPLRTSPLAVLTVGGTSTHLAAGFAWEVNNLVPHGAFNSGRQDRIHLIFEVFEGAGQEVLEVGAGGGLA